MEKMWNTVDSQQNTQEIKENAFLIGQNLQFFQEVLFFKLSTTIKTEKQTSDWLSLFRLDAGRLAEGKGHETDWRDKEKPVT